MSDWDFINDEIEEYQDSSSNWGSDFWKTTQDLGSELFTSIGKDTGTALTYSYRDKLRDIFNLEGAKPPQTGDNTIKDLFGRVLTNITDQSNRQGLVPSQALPSVITVGGAPNGSGGGVNINTNILLIGGLILGAVMFAAKLKK